MACRWIVPEHLNLYISAFGLKNISMKRKNKTQQTPVSTTITKQFLTKGSDEGIRLLLFNLREFQLAKIHIQGNDVLSENTQKTFTIELFRSVNDNFFTTQI